ncbi:MAG: hypothetical protein HeimC3_09910 [Candidatus Heimdallarchaeota archaeon LC_3]|nr:MAG: hypothetical protein HeimC3_09910 [Candidatus Heimdallarchaeota archaeon LC_3]
MGMNLDEMISKMAKMYPMFLVMGAMIVVMSFVLGFFNSTLAAEYFAASKATRETTLLGTRAAIEGINHILPYFKFLGVGMILSGIVMAIRVIIDKLREIGDEVLTNLPANQRPATPKPPAYAMLVPGLMMFGMLIFLIAFLWSLLVGFDAMSLFGNNTLPAIDADSGALLAQLRGIESASAILIPLKFFGIATEFLAIAIGLTVIVYALTKQTDTLEEAILS